AQDSEFQYYYHGPKPGARPSTQSKDIDDWWTRLWHDWVVRFSQLFEVVFFGLGTLSFGQTPEGPDLKEDQKEIANIQKDIARDQDKLNQDTAKFGATSPQVQKDQADLQLDKNRLANLTFAVRGVSIS